VNYGTSVGGSNILISSKGTKQEKDAAWEFLQVGDGHRTDRVHELKDGIHAEPQRARSTLRRWKLFYAALPQFKVAIDQMAYADGRPTNPGYNEAINVIKSALDAVWVNRPEHRNGIRRSPEIDRQAA